MGSVLSTASLAMCEDAIVEELLILACAINEVRVCVSALKIKDRALLILACAINEVFVSSCRFY